MAYNSPMLNLLPSIVALGLAALFAGYLAWQRRSPPERGVERNAAARALMLALIIQSIHFTEETATGFHDQLPALFGLPGIPFTAFVGFNLAWIAIWIMSVPGLRSARPAAFFAAWFLAIAGSINGIAHPLLALFSDGYFPGLFSSPFIGAASVLLLLKLRKATG